MGVKKPPYKPPITNKNSTKGAHTSFKPLRRSPKDLRSPAGSQSGRKYTISMMVMTYMLIANKPGTLPAMNSLPMSCCVKMA